MGVGHAVNNWNDFDWELGLIFRGYTQCVPVERDQRRFYILTYFQRYRQ
jgi:hypothetical protein